MTAPAIAITYARDFGTQRDAVETVLFVDTDSPIRGLL
jgi:hypothetical protein